MQLMELVCTQIKPLGLHVFLLRLVFLSFVKLSTEKISSRHHGRVLGRASRSSEESVPASGAECVFICLVAVSLPGCRYRGDRMIPACASLGFTAMTSTLALAPLPALSAPITRAFVHTFVPGLFLHGLLPEFEFFSSSLGVSWILFLLAADQEVILSVSLCSAFLFTKDFSFALSVR